MRTLLGQLGKWCMWIGNVVGTWLKMLVKPQLQTCRRVFRNQSPKTCRRGFAPPKPKWVRHEIICLKAVLPEAGSRMIAHHFNRRWQHRRQMTVSKTYVAEMCRKTSTGSIKPAEN